MTGPETISSPASPDRRPRWLPTAVAALLMAVYFYSPVRQVMDPTLDGSNYATFAYFTAKEFQFGTEVMHVGGPYGFVHYGFLYAGNLFIKRYLLELLIKFALGLLVVWFVRRFQRGWLRWFWLAAMLYGVPLFDDLPYDMAVLLAGLCLMEVHLAPGRRAWLTGCGLCAFLALFTLVKGTHALLALATLGLLGWQAVVARNFRRLAGLAATYGVALLIFLTTAGQNPANFPAYLHSIIEQSSGYNAAMILYEPLPCFLSGFGAFAGLELLLLALIVPRWRRPEILAGGILLAGLTFGEWKHGFVRADGHVFIFYHYAFVAAPTILLFGLKQDGTGGPRFLRWIAGGLTAAIMALGLWGDGARPIELHRWMVTHLPRHVATAMGQIAQPWRLKARLGDEINRQREIYQLPLIRDVVGQDRIDFFGTQHGYLILNRLNYRPRPAGGGAFSVFTPWLQDANAVYLANPATRPEFQLVDLHTIDNRLLAQDDSITLRYLVDLYEPVRAEQGMVLFKARPGIAAPVEPRFIKEEIIALDQPVGLPEVRSDEIVLASLEVPMNWRGRFRSFLYKAPLLFMNLRSDPPLKNPDYRRVVPPMFTRPVILGPAIEDTDDLISLYQPGAGKSVRTFQLFTAHPGLFAQDRFAVRFYAAPRPGQLAPGVADGLRRLLRFPVANILPESMEPADAPLRIFDGMTVQMLEPPGRIRFKLNGRENELFFKYGIDAEAYQKGKTDGAEFFVDLLRPNLPPQQLFRRLLRPGVRAADRGFQFQRVVLPPLSPGSSLVLRTGAGPDHDSGWDWCWVSGIRLQEGGYLPEQFPDFSLVPVAVEAATCGAFDYDGLNVFMLNSSGRLFFALPAKAKKLVFGGGLLAGAYTRGGQSDGVDFIVELRLPDGARRPVFRRHVNPRDNPADRGTVRFEVPLPDRPDGSQLVVATGEGPSGSNAWDWSYLEYLSLE